jgi:hypothetical protein
MRNDILSVLFKVVVMQDKRIHRAAQVGVRWARGGGGRRAAATQVPLLVHMLPVVGCGLRRMHTDRWNRWRCRCFLSCLAGGNSGTSWQQHGILRSFRSLRHAIPLLITLQAALKRIMAAGKLPKSLLHNSLTPLLQNMGSYKVGAWAAAAGQLHADPSQAHAGWVVGLKACSCPSTHPACAWLGSSPLLLQSHPPLLLV